MSEQQETSALLIAIQELMTWNCPAGLTVRHFYNHAERKLQVGVFNLRGCPVTFEMREQEILEFPSRIKWWLDFIAFQSFVNHGVCDYEKSMQDCLILAHARFAGSKALNPVRRKSRHG